MRFDAKFTTALAVSVFAVSVITAPSSYATTSQPARPDTETTSVAKTDTKKNEKKSETKEPTIVTVKAGDSLSKIAKSHDTTWVRIFNANETIADPDAINPGDKLTIPEADEKLPNRLAELKASVPAPVAAPAPVSSAPVATAPATYTTQSYSSAPVNSTSYYVGNGMWCTDYVHSVRPDVAIYGNAGYNWISAAQADGKSTGSTPRAGAVAVTNGHVAYVEKVNADGSYVVSEMGWNYSPGVYNERTVSPGAFGKFIY